MPSSPRITFRIPQHLLDAATARAANRGEPLSDYVRRLIERDCKVDGGDMPQGFANPELLEKALRTRYG